MKMPVIAITQGEPAGIGPEIARAALRHPRVRAVCKPLLLDFPPNAHVVPGRPSAQGGVLSFSALREAVALAKRGVIQGVVTAPIDKRSWDLAGIHFPGHTEALAAMTHARRVTMMFVDRQLMVSLVTRHVPLVKVSRRLTRSELTGTLQLTVKALKKHFALRRPRVTVLALNPHGGQDNLFGQEERQIIVPVVKMLQKKLGASLKGPVPADSAFRPSVRIQTDAYVAMYHDQGLIPFKMLAFERGVNVTLGLPFVRTSPDHGTAYDLVGTGRANSLSMIEAVVLAARMARTRSR